MTQKRLESCVTAAEAGWPTGRFLAERMQVSKRQLARLKLLDDGIWVNGTHATVRRVLQTGDRVSVRSEAKTASPIVPRAQELAIVYEDEALLVLDKPAGWAVYPRFAGDVDNLASGVLAYWQTQAGPDVFRPLLRLDKGTSGLIAVAKNAYVQQKLQTAPMAKVYLALAGGDITADGVIDAPIGRGEGHQRMIRPDGKSARSSVSATARSWPSPWQQAVRTRSACIWPPSVIPSWAMRFMAATAASGTSRRCTLGG